MEARVQRVPLIVVQPEVAAPRRREIREAAADRAFALGVRIGVSEIDLAPFRDLRRANGRLSPVQPRARDGQSELVLLVALAAQRNEAEPLRDGVIEQRAAHR